MRAKRFPSGPRPVINVTQEIMENSVSRHSSHCMIATAIEEALPEVKSVSVDLATIRFSDPVERVRYTYLTPRAAQVALIQFDQGEMPKPFSFRLRGAMANRMKERHNPPKPISETKLEVLKKARAIYGGRAKLVVGEVGSEKPRRIGGRAPPQSNFAKRREFGLRALRP